MATHRSAGRSAGRVYYGWVIVGVSMISMAFWFGFRSIFSVFLVPMVDHFGWSRADISGVQSVAMICYIVAAPLAGGLIDRFGPRRVILPGIAVLSVGLALCSRVNGLFQFYLYYGVIGGTSVAFISIAAYTAIIPHWFERHRGAASGFATSGMGLGIMVFPPLVTALISGGGWRSGFLVTGVLTAVILLPLNGLLLRHKPEDMGYAGPEGEAHPNARGGAGPAHTAVSRDNGFQWSLASAACTVNFWAMLVYPMLIMVGVYMVVTHFVGFLIHQGVGGMVAATAFGMIGLTSTIFRLVWGPVSDRIGREWTFSIGMFFFCASFCCLFAFRFGGGMWLVYLFVILIGIGWGSTAPMFIATAADLFHGPAIGMIYGLVEGSVGIGGAFGSWIGGYVFDRTGSYMWAFGIAVVAAALAGVMIWVAAPGKGRQLKKRLAARHQATVAG